MPTDGKAFAELVSGKPKMSADEYRTFLASIRGRSVTHTFTPDGLFDTEPTDGLTD